jgi:hypothetical protein
MHSILACALLTELVVGLGEEEDHAISVEMMSHSFSAPFRYDSSFPNWYMSGSTMFMRESRQGVVLNPPIPARQGFLLNKKVLKTNEFDLTVTLGFDDPIETRKAGPQSPKDQKITFRFTPSDLSTIVATAQKKAEVPDWSVALTQAGFEAQANNGIAIEVSPVDLKSGLRIPNVRLRAGGKEASKRLFDKETEVSVIQMSYLRLRVRFRPDSVTVLFQEWAEWKVLAEIKSIKVPTSGFLGITSRSGAHGTLVPYRAKISSVHVKSYDLKAIADEAVIALFANHGLSIDNLLDSSTYADPISQTKVIRSLSHLMQSYLKTNIPEFNDLRRQVTDLQKNVTEMDTFIHTLTKESRLTFGESKNKNFLSLAAEVKSIHSALKQVEYEREELVRQAQQASEGAEGSRLDQHIGYYQRALNSKSDEINEMLESQNRTTLIMFLIVFATAVGMGMVFYYRLQKYAEKAHAF